MKVSGFTIARNAIKLGYPIEESIRSILSVVDEMVVAVGDGEDETWDVVAAIGDAKIKAFRTTWDMSKRGGGVVLAEQTNLALAECTGDWALYLQTDELLHEGELGAVRRRLEKYLDSPVEGLSFRYLHFYGSYDLVQDNWCRWYRREVRAVKTGVGVTSVGDAAGFKISRGGRQRRLIRADSGAHVYHYGWCRPPEVMSEKRQHVQRLYYADGEERRIPVAERIEVADPYRHLGHLCKFEGTHPTLMQPLVASRDWSFEPRLKEQPPRPVRYMRLLFECPRDSLRILVSRLMLAWNSHVPTPKLR